MDFLNLPQACFAKLPAEVRFELTLIKGPKNKKFRYEDLVRNHNEAESIANREIGSPYDKVYAAMMRCRTMVLHTRY